MVMKRVGKIWASWGKAIWLSLLLFPPALQAQHLLRFNTGTEYQICLIYLTPDTLQYLLWSDKRVKFTVPMEVVDTVFHSAVETYNRIPGYLPDNCGQEGEEINYALPDFRHQLVSTAPPPTKYEVRLSKYQTLSWLGGGMISAGLFMEAYIHIEGVPNYYVTGPLFVMGGVLGITGLIGESSVKKKLGKTTCIELSPAPAVGGLSLTLKF
jgi:hypothetical protein